MTVTTQSRSSSNNRIKQPRQQAQPEDFFDRLRNMPVRVFLPNGQQLLGVLNMVSRFQIGLLVNGEQVYINKGFIIMIKPEQLPGNGGENAKGGNDHGSRRLVG